MKCFLNNLSDMLITESLINLNTLLNAPFAKQHTVQFTFFPSQTAFSHISMLVGNFELHFSETLAQSRVKR